ncbi:MAG: helix-turn-helix transcriptional regulator [Clostridia bacterium]|nr:helix-turn-helix transcriptional regulator [Clostridia bacterium]
MKSSGNPSGKKLLSQCADCGEVFQASEGIEWHSRLDDRMIEIVMVIRGSCDVMTRDSGFVLTKGMAMITECGSGYSIRCRRKNRDVEYVKLVPGLIIDALGPDDAATAMAVFRGISMVSFSGSDDIFLSVCSDLRAIKAETQKGQTGFRTAILAHILSIFTTILRIKMSESGKEEKKDSQNPLIRKCLKYVSDNYPEATLSSAAEICGVSYWYLSRQFKENMGMSFSDYVNMVRISRSVSQLLNSKDSITEIALSVGFSSTSYYIQTFKKIKNCSPNALRKKLPRRDEADGKAKQPGAQPALQIASKT